MNNMYLTDTGSRVESGHFHAQLYIYYTDLADMDLFLTLKW